MRECVEGAKTPRGVQAVGSGGNYYELSVFPCSHSFSISLQNVTCSSHSVADSNWLLNRPVL
jgi:hypothetical protein